MTTCGESSFARTRHSLMASSWSARRGPMAICLITNVRLRASRLRVTAQTTPKEPLPSLRRTSKSDMRVELRRGATTLDAARGARRPRSWSRRSRGRASWSAKRTSGASERAPRSPRAALQTRRSKRARSRGLARRSECARHAARTRARHHRRRARVVVVSGEPTVRVALTNDSFFARRGAEWTCAPFKSRIETERRSKLANVDPRVR